MGCHPTRSTDFDKYRGGPDAYLQALDSIIAENMTGKGRVVAIGECGLDYDRTHFAPPEVQKKYFSRFSSHFNLQPSPLTRYTGLQLSLAKKYGLPLFLHSRSAHTDFVQILREEGFGEDGGHAVGAKGGVVHSFTGSIAECEEYVS